MFVEYRITIFVNRGWVPRHLNDFPRPEGRQQVYGAVSMSERKAFFSPVNDPKSKILLWLEGPALVSAADLQGSVDSEPVVIEEMGKQLFQLLYRHPLTFKIKSSRFYL